MLFNLHKETKLIEAQIQINWGRNNRKVVDYLNVYEEDEVDRVIDMFFENKSREFIDPIMDTCVERI